MQFKDMLGGKACRRISGDRLCWYLRKGSGGRPEIVMCFPPQILEALGWGLGDKVKFVVAEQDYEQLYCVIKADDGLMLGKSGGKAHQPVYYLKINKAVTSQEAVKFFGCNLNEPNKLIYPKDGWPHCVNDGVLIFASKKMSKGFLEEINGEQPLFKKR